MDLDILKIASNTDNNRNIKEHTHFSRLKNSLCGDEIKIKLIIKNNKINHRLNLYEIKDGSIKEIF